MIERALIVGAGDGISAAFARRLHRDGAKVALAARDINKLGPLVKETGGTAYTCDVADPESVRRLFEDTDASLGTPDVVLFNPSFRTRGPIRTCFMGRPHGDRSMYFCSELATETCVAAGLMDPETTRPSATYPADLFWGRSINPYLDHHLNMDASWWPPARWFPAPPAIVSTVPLHE